MLDLTRREHLRAPAIIKVNYQSQGALRSDYAQNISQGGIFIAAEGPFEVGQQLELHLAAAGVRRTIPVPGEVRWVGKQGDPPVHGIGVKFHLDDPVTRSKVERLVNAVFEPIPPAVTGERANILIVDSNRHATRMFSEGLQSMARRRYEVDDYFLIAEAYDGASALDYLQSTRFSLVIVEMRVPEVDGVELIRCIRTQVSQSLPVFAVSRPYPGDRQEALSAGADAFVHKPIRLRTLFNTVQMMLNLDHEPTSAAA